MSDPAGHGTVGHRPNNVVVTTTLSGARRCDNDVAKPRRVAVLFDMDGLLIDSEPLWLEAETAVMARLGADWTRQDQAQLIGGSLERTVRYLLSKATRPVPSDVVGEWLMADIAERVRRGGVPLQPGARELLASVKAAGLPHALVTSSEREIMDAVLQALSVSFPVTVCAGDVSACKPDPEGYLLAAAKLAVDPRRCVVIEDSPNGVAAAETAGCLVVAVPGIVPIPAAPGRLVVSSLSDLSLPRLQAEFARLRPGLARPGRR